MGRILSESFGSGIAGLCVLAALVSAPARSEDTFCDSSEPWDFIGYSPLVRPMLRLGADDDLIVCTFTQVFSITDSPGDRSKFCEPPHPYRTTRDFDAGAFLGYFTALSVQACLAQGIGKFDEALKADLPTVLTTNADGKLPLKLRKLLLRTTELHSRVGRRLWPGLYTNPIYKLEPGEE